MARDFDIVVVGGGHAGVEAAHAAARLGARTALVTLAPAAIGQMSCNPAVGGIGKGQMVREIDALGGLMGRAADATGIQFRMLNRSKGPAVWGPRCQSDRYAYARWVREALASTEGLTIVPGEVTGLRLAEGRVRGVLVGPPMDAGDDVEHLRALESAPLEAETQRAARAGPARTPGQRELCCEAVIVTAGTFLGGLMHVGEQTWPGGRYGESASTGLSSALRDAGLELGRMKTGTCPRVDARTIDTDRCTRQDGDEPPAPFSFLTDSLEVQQVPCWLTSTTPETHEHILRNLHRAPLYTGQIRSIGPRYCPSIETKLEKFPDKTGHLVFLEPEGRDTHWVYCNGISTSLPIDVQEFMLRHTPGLGDCRVLRWGYAIEYDFAPPTQLTSTLRAQTTTGLYLAGQVNGTTGYEEAAAQGLVAGVNAVADVLGGEPLVLGRDEAYIGVMIDDLVTKGVTEPYRMFTSRAEHRLSLRADNAERRLTPVGRRVGLVDDARWRRARARLDASDEARELLRSARLEGKTLWTRLQQPGATLESLLGAAERPSAQAEQLAALRARQPLAVRSACIDAQYAGYLAKQDRALGHLRDLDAKRIPDDCDYAEISHLRHEAREKLSAVRPGSLGQALRVSGITPADVTILAIHLAKGSQRH